MEEVQLLWEESPLLFGDSTTAIGGTLHSRAASPHSTKKSYVTLMISMSAGALLLSWVVFLLPIVLVKYQDRW